MSQKKHPTRSRHPSRVITCFTIGTVRLRLISLIGWFRVYSGGASASSYLCVARMYRLLVWDDASFLQGFASFLISDMLVGGIKPHLYCLPILKAEIHREALLAAATSGVRATILLVVGQ